METALRTRDSFERESLEFEVFIHGVVKGMFESLGLSDCREIWGAFYSYLLNADEVDDMRTDKSFKNGVDIVCRVLHDLEKLAVINSERYDSITHQNFSCVADVFVSEAKEPYGISGIKEIRAALGKMNDFRYYGMNQSDVDIIDFQLATIVKTLTFFCSTQKGVLCDA